MSIFYPTNCFDPDAEVVARDLKVDADVVCRRDLTLIPSNAGWRRYEGRIGTVATINRERMPTGRVHVEVGVRFSERSGPSTWFLPIELQRVYGRYTAPRSPDRQGVAVDGPVEVRGIAR